MRFQKRDGAILQALYDYDGVLARRHLKAMFWPQASWRAMEMRLALLHQEGYIDWPSRDQWRTQPIPEAICWLGWRGACWIAGQQGIEISPSATVSETHVRAVEAKLRKQGIRWMREPRWHQLVHDLAVVDVRLSMERAVALHPSLTLETWIPESVFRAQMNVVEFAMKRGNGRVKNMKKGVRPDGYCVLFAKEREAQGKPARARLLLEVDNATHDNTSFATEKAAAGLAYVRSQGYLSQFGENAGRWLIVTTSDMRMRHLINATRIAVGEARGVFFFTTFDRVMRENVLSSPIWFQVGQATAQPLLNS